MIDTAYLRRDTGNLWDDLAQALHWDKYVGPFPPVSLVAVESGVIIAAFPIDLSSGRCKQLCDAYDEIERIKKERESNLAQPRPTLEQR